MTKKIKFGVAGVGHIGSRHAQCIIDNNRADLLKLFDVLPLNKWRFDTSKKELLCSSFEDLINSDVDVVNICTPNYLHAQMAIEALQNYKHVVIEKPMALSSEDAEKIINTAQKVNKHVFCVMQNRFSPTMIWLKDVISKQLLGTINMVVVNCFWNRNKNYYLDSDWHGSRLKDGGPLFTQFSHFIDILYWLFGEIDYTSSQFFSFNQKKYVEFEDSGIVKLNFANKAIGVLNYSTAVWKQNFESSITILGACGSVKIGGQYMDKILDCEIDQYNRPHIDDDIACNDYGGYMGSASNHDKMIDNVVQVLLDEKSVHTNSFDGFHVVKIIESIYSSRN
ncbi:MAG: oxidoreductase [Flavobacteriales bacterium]|nr:oxidoreductase [Flavobacteriales bacterium]|tara:strand:+ start:1363 stop:2373 length:1011 start_codon:yes stop_codon:yes gene_type:complete